MAASCPYVRLTTNTQMLMKYHNLGYIADSGAAQGLLYKQVANNFSF